MESRCIWTMNSLFEMVGWCWLLHFDWVNGTNLTHIFLILTNAATSAGTWTHFRYKGGACHRWNAREFSKNSRPTDAADSAHFYNVKPDFYNVYNIASHLPSIFCDWIPVPDMWCQVPLGSFRPQASHSASFFYAVSWSEVRIGQGEATDLQWSTDLSGHWHKTW